MKNERHILGCLLIVCFGMIIGCNRLTDSPNPAGDFKSVLGTNIPPSVTMIQCCTGGSADGFDFFNWLHFRIAPTDLDAIIHMSGWSETKPITNSGEVSTSQYDPKWWSQTLWTGNWHVASMPWSVTNKQHRYLYFNAQSNEVYLVHGVVW